MNRTSRRNKLRLITGIVTAGLVALAGCSSSKASNSASSKPSKVTLPGLPSVTSVKTQTINPYSWGPKEATINTWFDSNIVR